MRGYERDEYEDWDEYEDDGDEQEEEEEGGDYGYEEAQQPTQEELDYLATRQKLKELIRKKMKKDMGTSNSSSRDKVNALRKDNYGSFFGPSQPVIAARVIQESKSLFENPDLAAKIYKTSHKEKKSSVSAPVSSKPLVNHPPSVKNGLKAKVEMRKNTRDYSFLLSEDAEVPASSRGPPPRNLSAPKSDARSAELMSRSRPLVNGRGIEVSNGHDGRKPMLSGSQSKPRVGLDKLTPNGKLMAESRKQIGTNNGSGPGRPLGLNTLPANGSGPGRPQGPKAASANRSGPDRPPGPKAMPARSSVPATMKANQPVSKNIISGARKPTPSTLQTVARKPTPLNMQSGNNRPTSSHGQSSVLRRPVHNDYQETSKRKAVSKQSLPSLKVQSKRSPPRHAQRSALRDDRPKTKPKWQLHDEDFEDFEGADPLDIIRKLSRYDPRKFRDDDDDVSDMEANFDDIMREEKRSAKIGRKEDDEQLRLIEEEARNERMRAKKRKMGH